MVLGRGVCGLRELRDRGIGLGWCGAGVSKSRQNSRDFQKLGCFGIFNPALDLCGSNGGPHSAASFAKASSVAGAWTRRNLPR